MARAQKKTLLEWKRRVVGGGGLRIKKKANWWQCLVHHVRSNSRRCKTNRFLCFFFPRVWMEIGVASGGQSQTWPTFGQHEYIYIHILSALFVRNFPSPSSRRGDCCERRPHLPSLPPVCPWKYIHTKVHRCSLFILLHDACPSAISLVHVIHIASWYVAYSGRIISWGPACRAM